MMLDFKHLSSYIHVVIGAGSGTIGSSKHDGRSARWEQALRDIADSDPADVAALDPEWSQRVAREALKEAGA